MPHSELKWEIPDEIVRVLVEHRVEFQNYLPLAQSWTGPEYFAACGVPREFYHPGDIGILR